MYTERNYMFSYKKYYWDFLLLLIHFNFYPYKTAIYVYAYTFHFGPDYVAYMQHVFCEWITYMQVQINKLSR